MCTNHAWCCAWTEQVPCLRLVCVWFVAHDCKGSRFNRLDIAALHRGQTHVAQIRRTTTVEGFSSIYKVSFNYESLMSDIIAPSIRSFTPSSTSSHFTTVASTHTAAWKDVATRGVFFLSRWQRFCFLNQILFSVDLVRARDRFLDRNLDVRKALISSGARGRGIICAPKRQTKFGARDHVDV